MESQPQNPVFRNNPENFHHAVCAKYSYPKKIKALLTYAIGFFKNSGTYHPQ